MKHSPRWWKPGNPETIYALMNVGGTWWKATSKGFGTLPAPHPDYAAAKFLKWPLFKICGPDSYNPCNSCWNNHCYITKHLLIVCSSPIGCNSVWLKGTPNGSEFLPSPQPLYAAAKISKWQSISNHQFLKTEKTIKILEILLPPWQKEVVFGSIGLSVCPSVCLFVDSITQKVMNGLGWNCMEGSWVVQWRTD